ncbi:unnamed protein product [Hyaloperonospora brassicae]|uniref:CDK5RAP3-like protein n=1 Tax=Hyaloperonospora brassicae TaxID=162125 RepID=A0AAV0UBH3_HYABA|nr:unnamed protein product [Hyaloperonospora brassicae]
MTDKRSVPIDIQYKRLLDALVDRRIVPTKWLEQHRLIRDAIAALYPELPLASDRLAEFCANQRSSHETLTYFDCKLIFQCLEQSDDGAKKNFFGQYTSPVLKRWSVLLRQYEKNNIFAAEAARIIAQNTAFEIPFLRKSIQQDEKQIADNNRKMADLTRRIAEYKRKLEVSCADMGIAGANFRQELRRLPLELPSILDEIANAICCVEIDDAVEYHQALQSYLHDCEVPTVTSSAESMPSPRSQKGMKSKKKGRKQTEVTEARESTTMEPFELVVKPHVFFDALVELREASDELVTTNAALDSEAEVAEISWDISADTDSTANADVIDWGIETVGSAELDATAEDAPVEIDWDITTVDVVKSVGADISAEGSGVVGTMPSTPAIAAKTTRVELLRDSEFRTRVLNDLLELRAFLRQRLLELSGSDSIAFANQFQGLSPLLEQQSSAQVEKFQAAVDKAVSLLTSKRLQKLVLIETSERYLDRHVASLEMLTKHMDKCRREIHDLEDKNVNLFDASKKAQRQISSLIATTKELKKELEAALPPLFKGYKVNIVGEVNSL